MEFIYPPFKRGVLFYLGFNVRIFLRLLRGDYSLVYSNDLDTLLGCRLGTWIRRKPLVFDSHELFTETPELIGKPLRKLVWRLIERLCIKGARAHITVSEGIAREFARRYRIPMTVVHNYPTTKEFTAFKSNRPTLIYQGALNMGRGIELAIDAMKYLTCYHLIIVGSGDVEVPLRKRVLKQNLFDRVEFRGRLPLEDLHEVTCTAWLGLSLEEDLGLSYRYAMPNKVFDYIMAQVPVLVSDLPEMSALVESRGIGLVARTRNPQELANLIADFMDDKAARRVIAENIEKASREFNWENEEGKMLEVVGRALS